MESVSNRIDTIIGVARATYDESSNLPATIEWQ